MTVIPRTPTSNNQQYTLDSQIAAGVSSLTLNQSVAGTVQAPGYCVIDRVDSSGAKTATKREYKYFTGVSSAQLTGLSNVDGTDQVHAVGAIVEFVPDVKYEADWYSAMITEHNTSGVHVSLPSLQSIHSAQGQLGTLSCPSLSLNRDLYVSDLFNASGASLNALPIRPTWGIPGPISAASTNVGYPVDMPETGTIDYVSMTLNGPVSAASLVIDINKNFTSIFTDQGTRLGILGGGTFASTASIGTKTFSRSDVFSIDLDAGGGGYKGLVVRISAR